MKYIIPPYLRKFFTLLFICIGFTATAQYGISGRVLDSETKLPIDFSTIAVIDATNGIVITGTTTDNGGRFNVESNVENVRLEISFLGYGKLVMENLEFKNKSLELGDIFLKEDGQLLEEVVVSAEKSTSEFKLDKRVFNVGTDLSSTGASALEVLNNVPSVNVDIEGQVALRGATGVQILINGKPSVLADDSSGALGTITADMIDQVEVITNPSAKYEAEGTSGIINIVLKKNEKRGINGSISLNSGVPHNHSVGFSMNKRTDNFNLFTQIGAGYRELPSEVENINRDLATDRTIQSIGEEFRNEKFYNFILGSDYYINEQNVITVSGNFAYEVEEQPSLFEFSLLDGETLTSAWNRSEVTSATNPKIQYEVQYKRDFRDDKDHQLLFSAIGNYFGKDQESAFSNDFTQGPGNLADQLTATSFNEGKFTFNLDYTKPFQEHWTIETGLQYLINDVSNNFRVSNEVSPGLYEDDPGLTNEFEFSQDVLGIYGTGSYEGELWGLKLGLRVENTALNTLLVNTDDGNDRNFTNLFPSAHTSYKLSEGISFQAGYSRRIYRPRLWDLNPFFNIRNNFNIRVGNPDLLPEFTDSYEVGSIFIFNETSINLNVYHRNTQDKVERVSTFDNGVTTWMPMNIGVNRATGLEANFKYAPTKKITLNGDANYNIFQREGSFNDQNFDFSADQWSGKLTGKYKISNNLDAEATVRYESRIQTIQGMVADNLFRT